MECKCGHKVVLHDDDGCCMICDCVEMEVDNKIKLVVMAS